MKRNREDLRELKTHNRMRRKEEYKLLLDYLDALIAGDIENSMKEFNRQLALGEIKVEGYNFSRG